MLNNELVNSTKMELGFKHIKIKDINTTLTLGDDSKLLPSIDEKLTRKLLPSTNED